MAVIDRSTGAVDLPSVLAGKAVVDGGLCQLPPGIHDMDAPLRITGRDMRLRGVTEGGRRLTRLRRGRHPDGRPYTGSLIEVVGAADISIADLLVDGGRFGVKDGAAHDLRHPLDPDRRSPRFLSANVLDAPACFEPAARMSPYLPDIQLYQSTGVELSDLDALGAVRIAVAIGMGCRDVRLMRCVVASAGDYGVWMGGGLPTAPPLPLLATVEESLPARISIEDSLIERSGAAGLYLEAVEASVLRTLFLENHLDAPYDDESGQIVIDYKARTIRLADCQILGGPLTLRRATQAGASADQLLGTFGIEACGRDITFENLVVEGNSREGVQLVGARDVRFLGARTRIVRNQLAARIHPDRVGESPCCNISVTTTGEMRHLNAVAGNLELRDIRCENGIILWAHPTADDVSFDRLVVENCDLSGPDHAGVVVGSRADGTSIRGRDWSI